MTTILIRRNRKGVITGYAHCGPYAKWHAQEPSCIWLGWTDFKAQRLRDFYDFEFEIGERAAAQLSPGCESLTRRYPVAVAA